MSGTVIDFPAHPVNGETFLSWRWDGVKWVGVAGLGGGTGDFPEAPTDGRAYGRNGQIANWSPVVRLTGDTMTGNLTMQSGSNIILGQDASNPLHPVTLRQLQGNYLPLTGGNVTYLTLTNDATVPTGAVTLRQVQQMIAAATTGEYLPLQGGTLSGPGHLTIHQGNLWMDGGLIRIGAGAQWYFQDVGSHRLQVYSWDTGWHDAWDAANGTRSWNAPHGTLMSLDGGGSLWLGGNISGSGSLWIAGNISTNSGVYAGYISSSGSIDAGYLNSWGNINAAGNLGCNAVYANYISSGGNIDAGGQVAGGALYTWGRLTCEHMMNTSGTFYVANNYAYYLGRGSDGWWRFVDNGVSVFEIGYPGTFVNCRLSRILLNGVPIDGVPGAWEIHLDSNLSVGGRVYSGGFITAGETWSGMFATGGYCVVGVGYHEYAFRADHAWNAVNITGNMYIWGGAGYGYWAGSVSDRRNKEDITAYERGLSEILQLSPRRFHRIIKGVRGGPRPPRSLVAEFEAGLIGQEVEAIIPEAVTMIADPEEHQTGITDRRYIRQDTITATMINAIKELAARVTAVESRLDK